MMHRDCLKNVLLNDLEDGAEELDSDKLTPAAFEEYTQRQIGGGSD